MAVKMRLMRMGKTKSPHYRVVVIDGRAPRDGRYIDLIGRYDPREDPSLIDIDNEKAIDWLKKGAQPTEAVRKILDAAGALTQFKIKSGQIHTVGAKPVPEAPPTEEVAEEPAEEPVAEEAVEEAAAEAVAEEEVPAEEPAADDTTPAEAADAQPAAAEEE